MKSAWPVIVTVDFFLLGVEIEMNAFAFGWVSVFISSESNISQSQPNRISISLLVKFKEGRNSHGDPIRAGNTGPLILLAVQYYQALCIKRSSKSNLAINELDPVASDEIISYFKTYGNII